MKIRFFIFFLISTVAVAEESLPERWRQQDYAIDWKYKAGEYFIYDCERDHYACVDKEGDTNCREERNFALEKKLAQYPCAPLKRFQNKKECVLKNYEMQDIGAKKRFCYPKN